MRSGGSVGRGVHAEEVSAVCGFVKIAGRHLLSIGYRYAILDAMATLHTGARVARWPIECRIIVGLYLRDRSLFFARTVKSIRIRHDAEFAIRRTILYKCDALIESPDSAECLLD